MDARLSVSIYGSHSKSRYGSAISPSGCITYQARLVMAKHDFHPVVTLVMGRSIGTGINLMLMENIAAPRIFDMHDGISWCRGINRTW